MFDGAAILMNIAHPVNEVEPVLAGQHRQHHKPPEVLKSQVFGFWSAGGIRNSGQDIAGNRYFRQMLDHSCIE